MVKSLGEFNISQSSSADIHNITWSQRNPRDTDIPKKRKTRKISPTNIIYTTKIKIKQAVKIFKIKENNTFDINRFENDNPINNLLKYNTISNRGSIMFGRRFNWPDYFFKGIHSSVSFRRMASSDFHISGPPGVSKYPAKCCSFFSCMKLLNVFLPNFPIPILSCLSTLDPNSLFESLR